MRVFVGTMHSNESEFEQCREAIARQENVLVEHHIIEGLPEWEAHNALWDCWNKRKHDFDLFVKIDADTILDDSRKLSCIADEFSKDSRITGMQIPLHDYFTDGPILGLNCFSPKVIFVPSNSRLHADHADKGHDVVLRDAAVAHLAPAGKHCLNPNDRQAFHFGLHRMKKRQHETIKKIFDAWQRKGGTARLIALHGAHAALSMDTENDYSSEGFERAFLIKQQMGFDSVQPVEYLVRVIA